MYKLINKQLIGRRVDHCRYIYRPVMSLFKADDVNDKRIVNMLNSHDKLVIALSDALIMLETYANKKDLKKLNNTLRKVLSCT